MKKVQNWFWLSIKKYIWAPALVFIVHLFSITVINIYNFWPEFDTPMHIMGGFSIAYFLTGAYLLANTNKIIGQSKIIIQYLLVFSLTCTITIFWEFAEYFSDRFLGTHMQGGVGETLLDMLLGMLGAILYILFKKRISK